MSINPFRSDLAIKGALLLVVAGFLAAFLWNADQQPPMVGRPMPDFNLPADSGGHVTLDDYKGKILVLNFWATWCGPCVEELPSLDRFARTFQGKGVEVLAVSVDDDDKAYQDFLAQHPVAMRMARDREKRASINYGTFKYPESYIAGRDGHLLRKIVGPADWMNDQVIGQFEEWLKQGN